MVVTAARRCTAPTASAPAVSMNGLTCGVFSVLGSSSQKSGWVLSDSPNAEILPVTMAVDYVRVYSGRSPAQCSSESTLLGALDAYDRHVVSGDGKAHTLGTRPAKQDVAIVWDPTECHMIFTGRQI